MRLLWNFGPIPMKTAHYADVSGDYARLTGHSELIPGPKSRYGKFAWADPLSVPLGLHCMELAALEAICRKLTT